jgi:hypothetical protein
VNCGRNKLLYHGDVSPRTLQDRIPAYCEHFLVLEIFKQICGLQPVLGWHIITWPPATDKDGLTVTQQGLQ